MKWIERDISVQDGLRRKRLRFAIHPARARSVGRPVLLRGALRWSGASWAVLAPSLDSCEGVYVYEYMGVAEGSGCSSAVARLDTYTIQKATIDLHLARRSLYVPDA